MNLINSGQLREVEVAKDYIYSNNSYLHVRTNIFRDVSLEEPLVLEDMTKKILNI